MSLGERCLIVCLLVLAGRRLKLSQPQRAGDAARGTESRGHEKIDLQWYLAR